MNIASNTRKWGTRLLCCLLFVCAVWQWRSPSPPRSVNKSLGGRSGSSLVLPTGPTNKQRNHKVDSYTSTGGPAEKLNYIGSDVSIASSHVLSIVPRNTTTPPITADSPNHMVQASTSSDGETSNLTATPQTEPTTFSTNIASTPTPTTTASPSAVTPIIELCLSGEVFGSGTKQRLTALPTVKRNLVDVNEAHHGRPVRVTVATWAPRNQTGRDRVGEFRAHVMNVFGPKATTRFLDHHQFTAYKKTLKSCVNNDGQQENMKNNGLIQSYLRYHGCHEVINRSSAPYAAYMRVDIVMRSPVLIRDATTEETRGAKSERRRIADLMGPTDLQAADLQRVGAPYYYVSTGNAHGLTLLLQGVTSNAAVYGAEELVVPHYFSRLRRRKPRIKWPRQKMKPWYISDWGGMGRRVSVAHLLRAFETFARKHQQSEVNFRYPFCEGWTSEVHLASHLSTSTLPRIRPLHLSLAGRCDMHPEIPVDASLIARQGMDGRDPNVFTDSLTGYIFTRYKLRLFARVNETVELANSPVQMLSLLSPESSRDVAHDELVQAIASELSMPSAGPTLAPRDSDALDSGSVQVLREAQSQISDPGVFVRAKPRIRSSEFTMAPNPLSVSPRSPGVKFLSHVLSVSNKIQCEPRSSIGLRFQHMVGLSQTSIELLLRRMAKLHPLASTRTSADDIAVLQEALCRGVCTKWPRDDGL